MNLGTDHIHRAICRVSIILLCSANMSAWCDALDNWSTNQVGTNAFRLLNVVYGNGRFVAAGGMLDGGALLSSENGVDWTVRANGGASCCPGLTYGLTFGGGKFVGVGHFGNIARSSDGIRWSYSSVDSVALHAVAYGLGRFVAVGGSGFIGTSNIFTSADAITWVPRQSDPVSQTFLSDVIFANLTNSLRFVAIGGGSVFISSNLGVNWARYPIPGGSRISQANGLVIVPFGTGTNLLSTDAVNWSMVPTGLPGALGKVAYAAGMFLARMGSGIASSADGTNWILHAGQTVPNPSGDGEDSGFAFDGHRLVCLGNMFTPSFFTYHSFVCRSDDFVGLGVSGDPASSLVLSGLAGRTYRIDYTDLLSPGTSNWMVLTNLSMANTQMIISAPLPTDRSQRFYRSALLP